LRGTATAGFAGQRWVLQNWASPRGSDPPNLGRHLNLRVGTVKHYATQLFKKMQARNRLEAIVATQQMSVAADDACL
jgi:hypothetical protein